MRSQITSQTGCGPVPVAACLEPRATKYHSIPVHPLGLIQRIECYSKIASGGSAVTDFTRKAATEQLRVFRVKSVGALSTLTFRSTNPYTKLTPQNIASRTSGESNC
jgi:hypothetical protein